MVTAHQVAIVILAEWEMSAVIRCLYLTLESWPGLGGKILEVFLFFFPTSFLAAASLVSSEQQMYFSVPCLSALYNVVLVTGNVLHLFSILHLMKTSIVYIKVIPIQLPESHSNITSQEAFLRLQSRPGLFIIWLVAPLTFRRIYIQIAWHSV